MSSVGKHVMQVVEFQTRMLKNNFLLDTNVFFDHSNSEVQQNEYLTLISQNLISILCCLTCFLQVVNLKMLYHFCKSTISHMGLKHINQQIIAIKFQLELKEEGNCLIMAIRVVEFSSGGYKTRKIFA